MGLYRHREPDVAVRGRTGDSLRRTLRPIQSLISLPAWSVPSETLALATVALEGAAEKLAEEPVVLHCGQLIDAFDLLVILSGRNDRQVRAIAEEIERVAGLAGRNPLREEGWTEGQWVALDYGDVIVHVFDVENREYYDLEHLWNAAPAYRPEFPTQR